VTHDCDCDRCRLADICIDCGCQIEPTRFYIPEGPLCAGCRDRRGSLPVAVQIQEASSDAADTPNGQPQGLLF
jgi:hypothetical protein